MMNVIRNFCAIAACLAVFHGSSAYASPESDALKQAYAARDAGDWTLARATATGVGRDVIDWHYLRAGQGTFEECAAFLARNADWPGLPLLAQRCEPSIPDSMNPRDVIAHFDAFPPRTGEGTIALAQAYQRIGAEGDAAAQAVIGWQTLPMNEASETYLMTRFPEQLRKVHTDRMRARLWAGDWAAAERLAAYLPEGWSKLTAAVVALDKDQDGVDAAINAVPAAQASEPVLVFHRFQWRARKGRYDDAVTLMLQLSSSRDALGEPEIWGDRRRSLARQMMRDGKAQIAYSAAARHFLAPDEKHYSDLEWLAGYIALRYLDKPLVALEHFNRFRLSVATPISLGRAGYWEGRALEALGAREDAIAAYSFGANYQTSFYGLLAAERLNLPLSEKLTGSETYPDYTGAPFMASSVLAAARVLFDAEQRPLAARFLRHLGESLSPEELAQLGDFALDIDPYLAVLVAKFAANQGVVLHRAYFPTHSLTRSNLPIEPALALAIARRESEFNPGAVSHAGARGLMQLMPRTGTAMADKLGIEGFQENDLHDPVLNARLGSAYLAQLREEFGRSIPLMTAAYNAGPPRATAWVSRYGDPRGGQVDPVDWIEHIPFRETRNYVMRVSESLVVYRVRLSGETGPITLSDELKAR